MLGLVLFIFFGILAIAPAVAEGAPGSLVRVPRR